MQPFRPIPLQPPRDDGGVSPGVLRLTLSSLAAGMAPSSIASVPQAGGGGFVPGFSRSTLSSLAGIPPSSSVSVPQAGGGGFFPEVPRLTLSSLAARMAPSHSIPVLFAGGGGAGFSSGFTGGTPSTLTRTSVPRGQPVTNQPGNSGFSNEIRDGIISYFKGIGYAGDQLFDTMGATSAQNQIAAQQANWIFSTGLKQAILNPAVMRDLIVQGAPYAFDYVRNHPGRVIGRAGTGVAIANLPLPGMRVGGGLLSILAAYGDVIHTIDKGAVSGRALIRAALGGEAPASFRSRVPLVPPGTSR